MSREEGEALRDEALSLLESRTRARKIWCEQGRAVAHAIARSTGQVTSDDVREAHPVPEDWDPRILGTLLGKRMGLHKIGETKTRFKQAHARPIAVWSLH